MFKRISKSFWWGFSFGIIISLITAFLTWPKIPLDKDFIEGTKIKLPKAGDPVGIAFPKDGDLIKEIFIVYGAGNAFENQGVVELTDKNDQTLKSAPVYFNSRQEGRLGPFIVSMNLFGIDPNVETGKIKLFSLNPKDGSKTQIGDFVNVRLK